jgi:hypothetical protein
VITHSGPLRWDYCKRFAARWDNKREALSGAPAPLVALDTPMGRIAVLICGDLLLDQAQAAVAELRASFVAVLSMTSAGSIGNFEAQARRLAASTHGLTLLCNSSVHVRSKGHGERRTLGFACPHTREENGADPELLLEHQLTPATENEPQTEATVAVYTLRYRSKMERLTGHKREWTLRHTNGGSAIMVLPKDTPLLSPMPSPEGPAAGQPAPA